MLNDEQKRVVDTLLNFRNPNAGYCYQSSIAFTIQMKGTTWEQQNTERQAKETEVSRLLAETFPAWKVGRFKEHPMRDMFPGLWIAKIRMPEKWHSLISMAYYIRWARQGLIRRDHYNAAACDPRWKEWGVSQAMMEAEDPVQWVTDTYGDMLENQFPMLIHTGPIGSSGHYLVIPDPEADACEETVVYASPKSFATRLEIEGELEWARATNIPAESVMQASEYELKRTKATNIQVTEEKISVVWHSKIARNVFEERHPACLLPEVNS